jgi:hypothetical protein
MVSAKHLSTVLLSAVSFVSANPLPQGSIPNAVADVVNDVTHVVNAAGQLVGGVAGAGNAVGDIGSVGGVKRQLGAAGALGDLPGEILEGAGGLANLGALGGVAGVKRQLGAAGALGDLPGEILEGAGGLANLGALGGVAGVKRQASVPQLSDFQGLIGTFLTLIGEAVGASPASLVPSLGGSGVTSGLRRRQLGAGGDAAGPVEGIVLVANLIVYDLGSIFGEQILDALPVGALTGVVPSGIVPPPVLESDLPGPGALGLKKREGVPNLQQIVQIVENVIKAVGEILGVSTGSLIPSSLPTGVPTSLPSGIPTALPTASIPTSLATSVIPGAPIPANPTSGLGQDFDPSNLISLLTSLVEAIVSGISSAGGSSNL